MVCDVPYSSAQHLLRRQHNPYGPLLGPNKFSSYCDPYAEAEVDYLGGAMAGRNKSFLSHPSQTWGE